MIASVSSEPTARTKQVSVREVAHGKGVTLLTLHEGHLLLVKLVHDDVVTGHVEQRAVLLHEVQAVLHACVYAKEVPRRDGNPLHAERATCVFCHL